MKINDRRSIFLAEGTDAPPAATRQELTGEIASAGRDITALTYGGIMSPNDATLATRGGGDSYKIYDDIERDCHAFAVLEKRRLAVLSREWQVAAGGDAPEDEKVAEFLRSELESFDFDGLCRGLLDAILKGFAVSELIWTLRENRLGIEAGRSRDQRRFAFDDRRRLRLKTWENLLPGEIMPDRKFIVHRFGAKDGNPYGLGLGTRLFWPIFFKRKGITFWLTFVDKFGSPTVVGTYPPGTPSIDQTKLLAAGAALSQEACVVLPEGLILKYLEGQRYGSINSYETLAGFMNGEISKAVLGETGTTDQQSGDGSRARDEVGNEVRLEIAKADSDLLSATLNATLCVWLTEYNFPRARPPKIWRSFDQDEDLKNRAERDKTLAEGCGVQFQKSYFMKHYDFEEDEFEVKAPAAPPAPGLAFAEPTGGTPRHEPQKEMEQAAEVFARQFKDLLGKRLEEITALLEESGDLPTFQKRLAKFLAAPPPKELVEALMTSGFAAHLLGRSSVHEG